MTLPRDDKGQFMSLDCPVCDCGKIQSEGDGWWKYDGLVDPDDTGKELHACEYSHIDGQPPMFAPTTPGEGDG